MDDSINRLPGGGKQDRPAAAAGRYPYHEEVGIFR